MPGEDTPPDITTDPGPIAPLADETIADEIKQEQKTDNALDALNIDTLVDRIADKVYDRVKGFTESLVTASQDVEKLVSESVAAKQEEAAPELPVDSGTTGEDGDVKPKRSHKLFARPGKRE